MWAFSANLLTLYHYTYPFSQWDMQTVSKIHPIIRIEGTQRNSYASVTNLTLGTRWGGWSGTSSGRFALGKEPQHLL
jgi:hypothetical protein